MDEEAAREACDEAADEDDGLHGLAEDGHEGSTHLPVRVRLSTSANPDPDPDRRPRAKNNNNGGVSDAYRKQETGNRGRVGGTRHTPALERSRGLDAPHGLGAAELEHGDTQTKIRS